MKNKHRLFSLFLLLPLCLSSCSEKRDISSLTKIEEIASNEEYILGVDLSSIIEVENAGGVFYDFNGKESDIYKVLSESGINYIRIRLWVDPFDEDGNSFEGGGNDLETDLEIARRAVEAGMKVLLDFHYSDFWAD
ncbi:MAG: glycosyl hydrolase 53 family protein, partial [Coprobacillus sp.]|nr:glycosyl hydrolase 53 family protein [Coprobacillus sp.]